MAETICAGPLNPCPSPGDSDNILLQKILRSILSGGGIGFAVAGSGLTGSGDTVSFADGGPYVPGAIPFATSPTTMGFDPTQLFWDDVNNRLGLGIDVPLRTLHVRGVPLGGTALLEIYGGAGLILDTIIANDARAEFRRLGIRQGYLSWDNQMMELISDFELRVGTNLAGGSLVVFTNGIERWNFLNTGHFVPELDNTYNIGSAALQVKTVFTPQVQFPAAQVPSADPNNLDDYQEGNWTPIDASGAGLAFTIVASDCTYTKIGRKVTAQFRLVYPATVSGLGVAIDGLPFTSAASDGMGGFVSFSNASLAAFTFAVSAGNTTFVVFFFTGAQLANIQLSASDLRGTIIYHV